MKKSTITVGQLKLAIIAEEIVFKNKISTIFENLIKSHSLIIEAEESSEQTADLNADEKAAMDKLMSTFINQVKKEAGAIKADTTNEKEQEELKKEFPELAKVEDDVKEGRLNEFVVTASLIAGILAALPKLIKILGWLVKGVGSFVGSVLKMKKTGDAIKKFAEKLMHAGDELHHAYIGGIETALEFIIPDFKSLASTVKTKIAELVYLVIVLAMGLSAGLGTFEALHHAQWVHASVEGALSAVKAGEIGSFLAAGIADTVALA